MRAQGLGYRVWSLGFGVRAHALRSRMAQNGYWTIELCKAAVKAVDRRQHVDTPERERQCV